MKMAARSSGMEHATRVYKWLIRRRQTHPDLFLNATPVGMAASATLAALKAGKYLFSRTEPGFGSIGKQAE
tara:strand:+ start:14808 stop:15020 length:213 start_codon:yes stop_codon:yes gene_type:complete